jgi:hypothetical protein
MSIFVLFNPLQIVINHQQLSFQCYNRCHVNEGLAGGNGVVVVILHCYNEEDSYAT